MATTPSNANQPWTVGRLLDWTKQHFNDKHVDEPRLCAEILLAESLGCRRIDLYARYGEEPTAEQRAKFRGFVKEAAEHRPIAYLVGHKEFYSLDFEVTPDVLIPRPETEMIVERALAWCKTHPAEHYDILDLGTGSGCIAITIAKRLPAAYLVGTDISAAVIEVAQRNADKHGVTDRVRFVEADMLDLPDGAAPPRGFDLVLSNPPYVAEHERESLPANVRDYEPHVALFSGESGTDSYQRIAAGIRNVLRPGGSLIVEIGHTQADAVEAIMTSDPAALALDGRFKDLGGIDRTLAFTLPT